MVKVICRIKPPIYENTLITKDNELLFTKKEKDIKNDYKYSSKYYKLDKFYNERSTNNEIFYDEVKPLLINSFYLFLYGHTGSGKTYTLFGNDYIKGIKELDNKMLSTLIDNKILTRQDLADLATDELVGKEGILQKRIEKSVAEKIIMDAREIYLNS